MCDVDFDFDTFDDDEFETIINLTMNIKSKEEELSSDNINDYKNCKNCNIQMQPDINNTLTCKSCGIIKNIMVDNLEYEPSMSGYNTSSNFHIPIKCVGKDAFHYQKQLRNNTSEYSKIQESNLRRQLEQLNYKSSEKLIIPKNILMNVLEQYKIIRDTSKIHRGDILKGIMGSLVYYECLKGNIVRKPKEISNWYSISENDLSKGDKILRDLDEKGILKLPIHEDNNELYIVSYLKRTQISLEYKDFLLELLNRIETLKLGNPNARLSTKISALIFLIVISKGINIQPEELSTEFNISISTFKSYYTEIFKSRMFIEDILNKYNIELPKKIPRKTRSKNN